MTEPQDSPKASPDTAGRIIRASLVILPIGTILLGIASFGIWIWKKDRVENRNLQFASALRQEPTAPAWERHLEVLTAVTAGTRADRLASSASYLESSLGAEGMGFHPQRIVVALDNAIPVVGVTAELTGKNRPREVVLVLQAYGKESEIADENESMASLLVLANWLTGEPVLRTLRFAALPIAAMNDTAKAEVLERFGEEMRRRNERVMHLVDVSAADSNLREITKASLKMAALGAVVHREALPRAVGADAAGYKELREMLLGLARNP